MTITELQKRYEEAENLAYSSATRELRRHWGRIADSRHGELISHPDYQQHRAAEEEAERWRQHVESFNRRDEDG